MFLLTCFIQGHQTQIILLATIFLGCLMMQLNLISIWLECRAEDSMSLINFWKKPPERVLCFSMISCSAIQFIPHIISFWCMLKLKLRKMLEEPETILVLCFGAEITKFIKVYFPGDGAEMIIDLTIKGCLKRLYQQFYKNSILMCLIFLLPQFMVSGMEGLIEEVIFIFGESGLLDHYLNLINLLLDHLIVNLVLKEFQFGKQLLTSLLKDQENLKAPNLQLIKGIIVNLILF